MASTSRDSQEVIAKKTWELENNVQTVNTIDDIFKYDRQQQQDILTAKPWEKEYVHNRDLLLNLKMFLPFCVYK